MINIILISVIFLAAILAAFTERYFPAIIMLLLNLNLMAFRSMAALHVMLFRNNKTIQTNDQPGEDPEN